MNTLDALVLCTYLAAVFIFGVSFNKQSQTPAGFTTANGRLPAWAVGLSVFGTYLSSNTFLGVPGKAFSSNLSFFVFSLSIPFAAMVASKFFVPFYRQQQSISAYEHLEQRFGLWARLYALVCFLLTQLARVGTILYGVALGLQALTGWDLWLLIVGMGTLVTIYTLIGGIEAVIWTDVVQSIVLTLGAVIIGYTIIDAAPGGLQAVYSLADAEHKWQLGDWAINFATPSVIVIFLYGFFINLNNFAIDQSFVQRYHTAQTTQAAKGSLWFGALIYLPISLLFFAIGAGLFGFYSASPEAIADLMASTESQHLSEIPGDQVLPYFIVNQLPQGLAGFILAALFAAAMSSIDTSLNSSASLMHHDVYRRFFCKVPTQNQSMRVLHGSTLGFGVLATLTGLLMIGVESLLEAWWQLSGAFAAGVLGLFLLGFIFKKTSNAMALTSLFIGLMLIFWMSFSQLLPPEWQSPFHNHMTIVIATLSILIIGGLLPKCYTFLAGLSQAANPGKAYER